MYNDMVSSLFLHVIERVCVVSLEVIYIHTYHLVAQDMFYIQHATGARLNNLHNMFIDTLTLKALVAAHDA